MDMTELKPLREEGQKSFGALVRKVRSLGVARTAVATASQLTKLQLLRLVAEYGMKGAVQFTTADFDLPNDAPTGTMQKESGQR